MGCGLSKLSSTSSDDFRPITRPQPRKRNAAPDDISGQDQERIMREIDRRMQMQQRSGHHYNMHGSRQVEERGRQSDRRARDEEDGSEKMRRLGEEYMQTFWEDAWRVQERVKAQRRRLF